MRRIRMAGMEDKPFAAELIKRDALILRQGMPVRHDNGEVVGTVDELVEVGVL